MSWRDPEHPGTPKRAKVPVERAPRVTWLTPFAAAWEAAFPGSQPPMGEWARNLRPLIARHGEAAVLERWGVMLACTPASVASAALLAKGWPSFAQGATMPARAEVPDFRAALAAHRTQAGGEG